MSDLLKYKDYLGTVHFSDDDDVFHGKIEFIRDLITFEGSDVVSLKKAFHEAVDDYLAVCKSQGKKPDAPFKGTFNVRTGPELHRRAALLARTEGKNLNKVVTEALETYLDKAG